MGDARAVLGITYKDGAAKSDVAASARAVARFSDRRRRISYRGVCAYGGKLLLAPSRQDGRG